MDHPKTRRKFDFILEYFQIFNTITPTTEEDPDFLRLSEILQFAKTIPLIKFPVGFSLEQTDFDSDKILLNISQYNQTAEFNQFFVKKYLELQVKKPIKDDYLQYHLLNQYIIWIILTPLEALPANLQDSLFTLFDTKFGTIARDALLLSYFFRIGNIPISLDQIRFLQQIISSYPFRTSAPGFVLKIFSILIERTYDSKSTTSLCQLTISTIHNIFLQKFSTFLQNDVNNLIKSLLPLIFNLNEEVLQILPLLLKRSSLHLQIPMIQNLPSCLCALITMKENPLPSIYKSDEQYIESPIHSCFSSSDALSEIPSLPILSQPVIDHKDNYHLDSIILKPKEFKRTELSSPIHPQCEKDGNFEDFISSPGFLKSSFTLQDLIHQSLLSIDKKIYSIISTCSSFKEVFFDSFVNYIQSNLKSPYLLNFYTHFLLIFKKFDYSKFCSYLLKSQIFDKSLTYFDFCSTTQLNNDINDPMTILNTLRNQTVLSIIKEPETTIYEILASLINMPIFFAEIIWRICAIFPDFVHYLVQAKSIFEPIKDSLIYYRDYFCDLDLDNSEESNESDQVSKAETVINYARSSLMSLLYLMLTNQKVVDLLFSNLEDGQQISIFIMSSFEEKRIQKYMYSFIGHFFSDAPDSIIQICSDQFSNSLNRACFNSLDSVQNEYFLQLAIQYISLLGDLSFCQTNDTKNKYIATTLRAKPRKHEKLIRYSSSIYSNFSELSFSSAKTRKVSNPKSYSKGSLPKNSSLLNINFSEPSDGSADTDVFVSECSSLFSIKSIILDSVRSMVTKLFDIIAHCKNTNLRSHKLIFEHCLIVFSQAGKCMVFNRNSLNQLNTVIFQYYPEFTWDLYNCLVSILISYPKFNFDNLFNFKSNILSPKIHLDLEITQIKFLPVVIQSLQKSKDPTFFKHFISFLIYLCQTSQVNGIACHEAEIDSFILNLLYKHRFETKDENISLMIDSLLFLFQLIASTRCSMSVLKQFVSLLSPVDGKISLYESNFAQTLYLFLREDYDRLGIGFTLNSSEESLNFPLAQLTSNGFDIMIWIKINSIILSENEHFDIASMFFSSISCYVTLYFIKKSPKKHTLVFEIKNDSENDDSNILIELPFIAEENFYRWVHLTVNCDIMQKFLIVHFAINYQIFDPITILLKDSNLNFLNEFSTKLGNEDNFESKFNDIEIAQFAISSSISPYLLSSILSEDCLSPQNTLHSKESKDAIIYYKPSSTNSQFISGHSFIFNLVSKWKLDIIIPIFGLIELPFQDGSYWNEGSRFALEILYTALMNSPKIQQSFLENQNIYQIAGILNFCTSKTISYNFYLQWFSLFQMITLVPLQRAIADSILLNLSIWYRAKDQELILHHWDVVLYRYYIEIIGNLRTIQQVITNIHYYYYMEQSSTELSEIPSFIIQYRPDIDVDACRKYICNCLISSIILKTISFDKNDYNFLISISLTKTINDSKSALSIILKLLTTSPNLFKGLCIDTNDINNLHSLNDLENDDITISMLKIIELYHSFKIIQTPLSDHLDYIATKISFFSFNLFSSLLNLLKDNISYLGLATAAAISLLNDPNCSEQIITKYVNMINIAPFSKNDNNIISFREIFWITSFLIQPQMHNYIEKKNFIYQSIIFDRKLCSWSDFYIIIEITSNVFSVESKKEQLILLEFVNGILLKKEHLQSSDLLSSINKFITVSFDYLFSHQDCLYSDALLSLMFSSPFTTLSSTNNDELDQEPCLTFIDNDKITRNSKDRIIIVDNKKEKKSKDPSMLNETLSQAKVIIKKFCPYSYHNILHKLIDILKDVEYYSIKGFSIRISENRTWADSKFAQLILLRYIPISNNSLYSKVEMLIIKLIQCSDPQFSRFMESNKIEEGIHFFNEIELIVPILFNVYKDLQPQKNYILFLCNQFTKSIDQFQETMKSAVNDHASLSTTLMEDCFDQEMQTKAKWVKLWGRLWGSVSQANGPWDSALLPEQRHGIFYKRDSCHTVGFCPLKMRINKKYNPHIEACAINESELANSSIKNPVNLKDETNSKTDSKEEREILESPENKLIKDQNISDKKVNETQQNSAYQMTFDSFNVKIQEPENSLNENKSNLYSKFRKKKLSTTCKRIKFNSTQNLNFITEHTRIVLQDDKLVKTFINYSDIQYLFARTRFHKMTAIEIFTYSGRVYFLDFSDSQSNSLHFISNLAPFCKNLELPAQTTNFIEYFRSVGHQYTELWRNNKISNFEYLMILNIFSGRSFNDPSQYPIFPWILSDYVSKELNLDKPDSGLIDAKSFIENDARRTENDSYQASIDLEFFNNSKKSIFRDLSKPIGALSSIRLNDLKNKTKDILDEPPYLYSSAPVSPLSICHYLVRIEPITTAHIKLQSGNFDLPERLFRSIKLSWYQISTQNNDFWELVPEFYFLPDFLENQNAFQLGKTNTGVPLDNVQLPPWAHNSPIEFVYKHRKALECDYVSANINNWIDLIWGYKQRGQEAINADNIFSSKLYDSVWEEQKKSGDNETVIKSCLDLLGQIPPQLFTEPHPHKIIENPPSKKFSIDAQIQLFESMASADRGSIFTLINDDFLYGMTMESNSSLLKFSINTFSDNVDHPIDEINVPNEMQSVLLFTEDGKKRFDVFENTIVFAKNPSTILRWNIEDKKNPISKLSPMGSLESGYNITQVVALNRWIIICSEITATIYQANNEPYTIYFYRDVVTCCSASEILKMMVIGTADGGLTVVSLTNGDIERVIELSECGTSQNIVDRDVESDEKEKIDQIIPKKILISDGWGFILLYAVRKNGGFLSHHLFLFTVNGKFVKSIQIPSGVEMWHKWKDCHGFDFVAFTTRSEGTSTLYIGELFEMNFVVINKQFSAPISLITYIKNQNKIGIIDKNGTFIKFSFEFKSKNHIV